jgi:hypothetical protein
MARPMKRNAAVDAGFERYRRERNKRRLDSGTPLRDLGDKSHVLQELEAAEAREVRNQQLTREVREFFADATRTAATIVQKVADEQEEHAEEMLARQMSEFLHDAVQRAQGYIQILQLTSGANEAHKEVTANMQNLVGPLLDGFRHEGTAQLLDKHIGQDPFSVDDEEVDASGTEHAEDEQVIEVELDDAGEGGFVESAPTAPQAAPRAERTRSAEPVESHEATAILDGFDERDLEIAQCLVGWVRGLDVDRFKATLKLLVQRGVMTKDDARELYRVEMTARAAH